MNCKIPFTKDIDFQKTVYEITSISLEHEVNIEDNLLKGNFIIAGDFKSHEVSVNKEPFSYVLPFEIDLREDIIKESVEFLIDDFTYEVVDNSILRVKIDFSVIGEAQEKEEEEEREAIFEEAPLFKDEIEKTTLEVPVNEEKNEISTLDEKVQVNAVETEKITKNEEEIITGANLGDSGYATYHIHMVSDGESVETICTMYNSNINKLSQYNDLNDLSSGDKLIIPEENE